MLVLYSPCWILLFSCPAGICEHVYPQMKMRKLNKTIAVKMLLSFTSVEKVMSRIIFLPEAVNNLNISTHLYKKKNISTHLSQNPTAFSGKDDFGTSAGVDMHEMTFYPRAQI